MESCNHTPVPQPAAPSGRRGFAYIAVWQFLSFIMLVSLIWVNEVLDLAYLIFGQPPVQPNIFRGCVLTAGVFIVAIVSVGNTFIQEQRALRGLITICSYCSRVRIEESSWQRVEDYIAKRSAVLFSHGICPDCFERLTSQLGIEVDDKGNAVAKARADAQPAQKREA